MIKPTFKLTTNPIEKNHAQIIIEPLPQNFGHTIGNALRRVLLSSLSGAAAVRVRINGVHHQFTTITGLQEDILEFVLNLKELRFTLDTDKSAKVKLNIKGKKNVTGKNLELPAGVHLANPDQPLATLTSDKAKLSATIEVEAGVGYAPAEKYATDEVGVIPLDASFSPVLKANYNVESTRVGRRTDLDRIILDVLTNGTLDPETAVIKAAKTLTAFFSQVHNPVFTEDSDTPPSIPKLELDQQSVDELDLPVRVINALKKGGYQNLTDLESTTTEDLIKVKNIGTKSAEEIIKKVKQKITN